MRGLYAHVPFCVRKCAYCDFYSLPGRAASITAYTEAVLREAEANAGMTFSTLYLGGGTPSLLGARGLTSLVRGLREAFDLSAVNEATIEVNPESATPEFLTSAQDFFTRVSVGVQSLSDRELQSVGRVHSAAQAVDAVRRVAGRGMAVSADLIAGLPGQDWESLRTSVERIADLGASHLSLYCLSLEEGTTLATHPPENLPPPEAQAELFEKACRLLTDLGFAHYEISNFARPGCQCRHNLNYWRGGEYLGLGPAAASHLNGKRFRNRPDLDAYLEDPLGQAEEVEELSAPDKAAEEAMLRLRLLEEGVDSVELAARFGCDATQALAARLAAMSEAGLLKCDGRTYRLPPERVLTSNPILAEVL